MYQLIIFVHVIVSILLIGLILIQQGKGADIGAAFGSGASNTVFGSQGSGGFLFKFTSILAVFFFATSLGLGYIVASSYKAQKQLVPLQKIEKKQQSDIALPKDSQPSKQGTTQKH